LETLQDFSASFFLIDNIYGQRLAQKPTKIQMVSQLAPMLPLFELLCQPKKLAQSEWLQRELPPRLRG